MIAAVLLAGCTPETFDRTDLLEHTGADVLDPVHDALRAASTDLVATADALCAAPSAATVGDARGAWVAVKQPLKQIEAWSFGPYRFFGIEIAKNADKWPGSAEAIEAIVAGTDPIDTGALDYRDRVLGLPAIEYLLYSDPTTDDTAARYSGTGRRCELLIALAAGSDTVIGAYHDAWSPAGGDYLGEVTRAGIDSDAYGTAQAAITALVSGMLTTSVNISANKLGMPLGQANGGTPDPTLVEAPHSGTSLDDVQSNLDGIEAVYVGTAGHGLSDYVQFREATGSVDGAVRGAISAARAAVEAVPAPLSDAVLDDGPAVQDAIDAVDALSVVLNGELSTLLGINPTTVEGDND